mmetsp:Transcript_84394/g.154740  ORF Transcript_84394/g.154740 Transcript_84394/m.154740 type:complete len:150 (+) Transcript_84394:58-507(+)
MVGFQYKPVFDNCRIAELDYDGPALDGFINLRLKTLATTQRAHKRGQENHCREGEYYTGKIISYGSEECQNYGTWDCKYGYECCQLPYRSTATFALVLALLGLFGLLFFAWKLKKQRDRMQELEFELAEFKGNSKDVEPMILGGAPALA